MEEITKNETNKCCCHKVFGYWWMKSLIGFIIFLFIFCAGVCFGMHTSRGSMSRGFGTHCQEGMQNMDKVGRFANPLNKNINLENRQVNPENNLVQPVDNTILPGQTAPTGEVQAN